MSSQKLEDGLSTAFEFSTFKQLHTVGVAVRAPLHRQTLARRFSLSAPEPLSTSLACSPDHQYRSRRDGRFPFSLGDNMRCQPRRKTSYFSPSRGSVSCCCSVQGPPCPPDFYGTAASTKLWYERPYLTPCPPTGWGKIENVPILTLTSSCSSHPGSLMQDRLFIAILLFLTYCGPSISTWWSMTSI